MDLLALGGVIAYYAFLLLGSVSMGYILLRLTYPDIRVASRERKLGYAGLAGAGVTLAAAATDFLLSPTAFLSATSTFPIIFVLFSIAGFFGLKTFSLVFTPKFVVVGIPSSQPEVQAPGMGTAGISSEQIPQVVVQEGLKRPVVISSKARAEEVRKQLVEKQVKIGELDVSRDVDAEKAELKKAGEADFDVMLRDLLPKIASPSILIPDAPLDNNSGSRHRLYLRKPAPAVRSQIADEDFSLLAAASASRPRENARAERKEQLGERQRTQEELGLMVQDVYSQLKTQKPEEGGGFKDKMLVKEPPKPESRRGKPMEKPPEPTLSMQDLFGEAAAPAQQQTEGGGKPVEETNPLFAQLNKISSLKKPSDVTLVKMPSEETGGCPRCHSKNSRIVFCPYCGSAMCANCTPSIKQVEGGFEFVCPKCAETVFVRKKSE